MDPDYLADDDRVRPDPIVLPPAYRLQARRLLVCEECGRADDGRRGWTLRRDMGGLAAACPECAGECDDE